MACVFKYLRTTQCSAERTLIGFLFVLIRRSQAKRIVPIMKKELEKERMFFWDKMIWNEREKLVEKKQLYQETTKFLINGN